jgi:hypothetical protein
MRQIYRHKGNTQNYPEIMMSCKKPGTPPVVKDTEGHTQYFTGKILVCLQQFDTVWQTKVLSLCGMRNENVTHLQQMTRTHSQRNTYKKKEKESVKKL